MTHGFKLYLNRIKVVVNVVQVKLPWALIIFLDPLADIDSVYAFPERF